MNASPSKLGPHSLSKVVRHADRASYDTNLVHGIIDEALVCHVSFVVDGHPHVLPTAHARVGNRIYLHGAAANRMLRTVGSERSVSLAFTLLDGIVFARTAFRHSMNYRSAVVFGRASVVTDDIEKETALAAIVDHPAPGRTDEVGAPTKAETRSTLVVRVEVTEASAKVRTGPAMDTPEQVDTCTAWAGVLPITTRALNPMRDEHLAFDNPVSSSVLRCSARLGGCVPKEVAWSDLLLSTDRARLNIPLIHRFLRDESYWATGIDRARVELALENSICVGLYRDGAQIGFARAVTDRARFAYLADVFVIPEHRGSGLGKKLVEFTLSLEEVEACGMILLGTRDAHGLYARYGWVSAPSERFMVRRT